MQTFTTSKGDTIEICDESNHYTLFVTSPIKANDRHQTYIDLKKAYGKNYAVIFTNKIIYEK